MSVGGQGHGGGGGGAGGRISVQCSDLIKFNVSLHAHGGECYMSLFGRLCTTFFSFSKILDGALKQVV